MKKNGGKIIQKSVRKKEKGIMKKIKNSSNKRDESTTTEPRTTKSQVSLTVDSSPPLESKPDFFAILLQPTYDPSTAPKSLIYWKV